MVACAKQTTHARRANGLVGTRRIAGHATHTGGDYADLLAKEEANKPYVDVKVGLTMAHVKLATESYYHSL